jgi:organic radical activating enzyme
MVQIAGHNSAGVDFSIMPTLECNLKCSFCMYNCSSDSRQQQQIDLSSLKIFLESIPIGLINSWGLYGGEPSINIPLYKEVIKLLPIDAPKFIITNGTWSEGAIDHRPLFSLVEKYNLHCFVSSTPEHKAHQNPHVISVVNTFDEFTIKEDDTKKNMLPMGRNKTENWGCNKRCKKDKRPLRFAAMPSGAVIFQTCDGVYPTVGWIDEPFNIEKYLRTIPNCCPQLKNF